MNQFKAGGVVKGYAQAGLEAVVEEATPHRLIQMMMEGALGKIAAAKGFMERGSIAEKGAHISWAVSIIDGLRVSLDKSEPGAEIAQNLEDLYVYMIRRLTEANLENKTAYLDEVAELLGQIKSAWDAIAPAIPAEAVPPVVGGQQHAV